MKERPILFKAPMVQAILSGQKTQTRRVIKPQPQMVANRTIEPWSGNALDLQRLLEKSGKHCPYGQPGDQLWVRETWFDAESALHSCVLYKASDDHPGNEVVWRSPIHMPRWASRILLEIVSVRVERLQDISEVDAIAEGMLSLRNRAWDRQHFPEWRYLFDEAVAKDEKPPIGPSPKQCYEALWNAIHGPDAWDANPWVWAMEFRRFDNQPA